ncbi:marine proteobacterial sortase target protein [bacterium SCSIO 12696]|nr:marine proteobacterial sortase target protein [bacterium SCSIO 12696]
MKKAWTIAMVLVSFLGGWPLAATANDSDPGAGTLLLRFDGQSVRWVAPTLDTDVQLSVNGPIVRSVVSQRFYNPSEQWAEASYLFPLPEDAAVDQLRMRIGERVIEGQIKERQQAKAIYKQAKQQGKRASLVEQQRPNLFTTQVANIPPGEQIVVEIEYQHSVARDGDTYSLRYPMTITPRYTPRQVVADISPTAGPAESQQPNQEQPVAPWPISDNNSNPTRIKIELDAGFELSEVLSPSHRLQASAVSPSRRTLVLNEPGERTAADRDFLLQWHPIESQTPQASLFVQQHNGEQYGLLQVTPPSLEAGAQRLPRDVVFVIDTSGSMGGEPIRQAKASLLWALQRLQPEDRFNIVQFNSVTDSLFVDVQQAIPGVLNRAQRYVSQLQSGGGTEMLSALNRALCKSCNDPQRVRQVIFITDGSVSNEDQLFRAISTSIGATRLFTVGIGSAPNSYFMRRAAEFGRGTFTYVADATQVQPKMAALYRKLEAPVLTDLKLSVPANSHAEILPNPLPDLYAGEPLVAVMKMAPSSASINVSGRIGEVEWQRELELLEGQQQAGVHQLWARNKIAQLNDLRRNQHDPVAREQIRDQVVQISLSHHLVSPFTSLVAVDTTPARPLDKPVEFRKVPNQSPHGTRLALPQTATGADMWLWLALLSLLVSAMVLYWQGRSRQVAC